MGGKHKINLGTYFFLYNYTYYNFFNKKLLKKNIKLVISILLIVNNLFKTDKYALKISVASLNLENES